MQKYAMLDKKGFVRKVTRSKPHPDALVVEYPELTETSTTHFISQKPIEQWEVHDDKVVVTYNIIPKDLEEEKEKKIKLLKSKRDEVIYYGVIITVDGDDVRFYMDETTIVRVDQAAFDAKERPTGWLKRWKIDKNFWKDLSADDIEGIRSKGADHIEACFRNEEAIENEIMATTTLSELENVSIEKNWPVEQ